MTTKDTKIEKKQESIPELKDGSPVLINGEEFVYRRGHFEKPMSEKSAESHFYLYFDDRYEYPGKKSIETLPKEVRDCPVKREGKIISIDIFPLLKEVFANKLHNMESAFKGVRYEGQGSVGSCALAYTSRTNAQLKEHLSRMLDMAFVNQNQLRSSKDYIEETLSSMFQDFWNLF